VDSLNGYLTAMASEKALAAQLHELLAYLSRRGVASFLVLAQHGMIGSSMASPFDASYIADTVVLLRFFEARGAVCKAISVLKKRTGTHEDTIRELRIESSGVKVGEVLREFRGVLTGTPEYTGAAAALLEGADDGRGD
jgi:circadian clock protein KaiC